MPQKIRCAVYTRKSTDEGLDKEFNTLEAQREACENYIRSQKAEGWELISEHYDDGGFSGGNMKRPAFQRLLKDINNGKVDMVVVYKIDRLTRSLLDFAKIVEIFDNNKCSFSSVTQHFNTADSMGRLLLNILLSFAQFEREVSSDRIRDKMAASKKKGMWMGGSIPLGYDAIDKKLVINTKEAEIINFIFDSYIKVRSEREVCNLCEQKGYRQKSRPRKNGIDAGNIPFSTAAISNILHNPIYIGKIKYKTEIYQGQHVAIVSEEIFDKVQKIKKMNIKDRLLPSKSFKSALLKGFVYCECCCTSMVPTRCRKNNKYYEYYTSLKAVKQGYHKCEIGSIPSGELDAFVIDHIKNIFQSPQIIQELTNQVKKYHFNITVNDIFQSLQSIDKVFEFFAPATLRMIIEKTINKVIVNKNHIHIQFKKSGIILIDKRLKTPENGYNEELMEFTYPINLFKKRGRRIIICPEEIIEKGQVDMKLVQAVCNAFTWQKEVIEKNISLHELSRRLKLDRSYIGRIMKLTFLAPDIIEAILKGKQPRHLKIINFTRDSIPYLWSEQRELYGFSK